MNSIKTVVIADDHPLFRTALREAVKPVLPNARISEADSFPALQAALQAAVAAGGPPDLVLLDLNMPGVRGFSSLLFLRSEFPHVPVIVVSGYEEPLLIQRVVHFGARGFIPKTSSLETMGNAVRTVLGGGTWTPPDVPKADDKPEEEERARRVASLSPQQLRVLLMLADGRLNKQIAHELSITEATVKAHMTMILRKLGLVRRTQAAVLAQRLIQDEALPLAVDHILDEDAPEE